MKNLSVQVEEDMLFQVKLRALKMGVSVREYLTNLINKDLKEERNATKD